MSMFVIGYYAILIGSSCLAAYYQKRSIFLLLFSLTLASFVMGIIGGQPALLTVTGFAGAIALAAGTSYAFHYVQGSLQRAPNCGTVYFKGKILGVGGEPVNGKTVRLRFAGNVVYRVSGEGQDPGEWSFAPLASEHYHSPFTFLIDVVDSQANPVAQSDTLEIAFSNCETAGQFTNILFQYGGGSVGPAVDPTPVPARTPTPTYVPQDNLSPVECRMKNLFKGRKVILELMVTGKKGMFLSYHRCKINVSGPCSYRRDHHISEHFTRSEQMGTP